MREIDLSKATDMQVAAEIGYHIDNPCGCEVDGEWRNIRPFYIRIAEEAIPNLTNPFAIEFLQGLIKQYS